MFPETYELAAFLRHELLSVILVFKRRGMTFPLFCWTSAARGLSAKKITNCQP